MNFKSILFRLLGMKNYLRVVSRGFFASYKAGRLKSDPDYHVHYYVKNLIKPGDVIIDIGGNLGYYCALFAEWTGENGQVYSVEPVPVFREILRINTARFHNVTVYPFALGDENGKKITMGVPTGHKHFRHGLTHVISQNSDTEHSHTFSAEMRRGSDLFSDLEKLDYIKMDVEGYEIHILPELKPVIEKHRPIIQVELGHESRARLLDFLQSLNYVPHWVKGEELLPLKGNEKEARGDLIFLQRK